MLKRIACRLKNENFGFKPFKPHWVTTVTLIQFSGFSLEIFNFHLDMGLLSGSGETVRFLQTPFTSFVRPAGLSLASRSTSRPRAGHRLAILSADKISSGVRVLTEAKPFASSGRPRFTWCARQDSNLQPFGPKPNALSFELRAHTLSFVPRKGAFSQSGNENQEMKNRACTPFLQEISTGVATGKQP